MSSGELLGDYDLKNIVQNRDGYREDGQRDCSDSHGLL